VRTIPHTDNTKSQKTDIRRTVEIYKIYDNGHKRDTTTCATVFVCVTSYIVNSKNYHVRSDREDVQDKDAHLYETDNIAFNLFS